MVSIRIPLSVILAGTYKVGLTPRDAAKKTLPAISAPKPEIYEVGGWISPNGKILPLKDNNITSQDYQEHSDVAEDMGFESNSAALAAGAVRIAMMPHAVGIEVNKITPLVLRSRIREFLSDLFSVSDTGVAIEWYLPTHRAEEFDTIEEAIEWLDRSRTASKIAVSLPDLVQQTNAFSTKYREGCVAKLEKSSPKDLFLQYRVTCHKPDSDPRGHETRVKFDVSKIEADQNANDLDVQCSCSCPAFLYWGAQWNLHQRDGLLGEPRPLLQAPTERLDLRSNYVICKHCKAVFERILPSVQHNINNIIRKKEVEEKKKEREGVPPPTMKRQPGQPSMEQEEIDEMTEQEAEKMLEQEGIVTRKTPATNEEKLRHPTLEAPKKPRWRETIDRLKERVKGWGGNVPTPESKKEEPKKNEDQKIQEELLREERQKLKMPMNKQHPEKPHVDEGLPYEPRWKKLVKNLKDRIKQWGKK